VKIALFLDFDGTLTKENINSWQYFRKKYKVVPGPHFDLYSEEKTPEGMERIIREWTSHDYEQLSCHITKRDISAFLNNIAHFRKGIEELSKEIEKNDSIIYVAIISGGYPDIVKRFAKNKGWDVYTSEVKPLGNGKYETIIGMHGLVKKQIMTDVIKKLSRKYKEKVLGVYIADDPPSEDGKKRLKGYELEDYGEDIFRIYMGKNNDNNDQPTVEDFYGVIREVQKLV